VKLLALDLGTHLGWALADLDQDTWIWGHEDFKPGRYDGSGMRYLRFQRWLGELLRDEELALVVVEAVSFARFQQASEVLNGMKAIAMAVCEARGKSYTSVPTGTLKKFATGKGNANKDAMAYALGERWEEIRPEHHLPIGDDLTEDEVDAIWLLRYAIEHLIEQPEPEEVT